MQQTNGGVSTLLQRWIEALAETLETFSGDSYRVQSEGGAPEAGEFWWWTQNFHPAVGPALIVGLEEPAARALARVLAGEEGGSLQEIRSTCGELLTNAGCKMAQSLGRDAGVDLDGAPGAFTPEAVVMRAEMQAVRISDPAETLCRIYVATSPALAVFWDGHRGTAEQDEAAPSAAAMPHINDALLEMSMPVTMSLGRVMLTLEQAFQLTTGALLELGSTADDPAELIVNGIPFARGHVVIVEGNYGLQITELLQQPGYLPQPGALGGASLT